LYFIIVKIWENVYISEKIMVLLSLNDHYLTMCDNVK